VLPRAALRAVLRDPASLWSVHGLSGAWQAQAALFALAALAAAALLAGHRARPAAALSWLLLVSVHHRNPLILTGAYQVLRLLLFWSLFVPIDARWAVRRRAVPESRVCSAASAALLLQVALVYAMSVLFKLRSDEWLSLTAIRSAFAVEGVATGFARELLQFPRLLSVAAAATLAIESLAAVLPFVPCRTGALRIAIAFAAIGMHALGVGTTMRLGLMPAVMTLACVPFLPGAFWDRLGLRERSAADHPAPRCSRSCSCSRRTPPRRCARAAGPIFRSRWTRRSRRSGSRSSGGSGTGRSRTATTCSRRRCATGVRSICTRASRSTGTIRGAARRTTTGGSTTSTSRAVTASRCGRGMRAISRGAGIASTARSAPSIGWSWFGSTPKGAPDRLHSFRAKCSGAGSRAPTNGSRAARGARRAARERSTRRAAAKRGPALG
jgi:hypothetical protein